ncbi:hypothetical protein M1506_01775 [Patescibacteria group bacterium]|nr:hypothetical protein [Patescibacteria group bacterium]
MKLNKSKTYTIGLLILVVMAGLTAYLVFKPRPGNSLDYFARCLSEKGLVMYGLYSCPHCQAEKELFGSSFKYVNYVECSENPSKCTAEGINAVPTWIEPGGERLVGTQSLDNLSSVSGCKLN